MCCRLRSLVPSNNSEEFVSVSVGASLAPDEDGCDGLACGLPSADEASACRVSGLRPGMSLGWLDGIPTPAALVTQSGEIAAASRALVKIVDAAAVIGRSLMSLLWPESREAAAALIARPQTSADDIGETLSVTMLATGTTYRLRVGAPFGTERAAMRLVLLDPDRDAETATSCRSAPPRRASSLIAGVAHEINNPLTFIIPTLQELHGELQLRHDAIRGIPVDEWISELEEVLEGVARIAAVVQNLRAVREVTPEAEPTSVNQVIANTVLLASASVPPGVTIRRSLGLVQPARANRQRLEQVLLNLVLDAAHAIENRHRGEGTIWIRSWGDDHHTWMELRDDGPGLAGEQRERIVEPFVTARARGAGLGLDVCRAMIRELGGELSLERAGLGARLRIRLPIWQESRVADSEPPQQLVLASRLPPARRRVLLVDDDHPVRRALRRMLSQYHSVEEASSLQEAIDKAQRSEFDVLVTDRVMNQGGGPALIDHLRQLALPLADHVIIISGMAPDATPSNYLRLSKPCTSAELLDAVEKASR